MNEPLVLTVEQAARLLGISRGLAYEGVRRGDIVSLRIGRRILIPRARLLELVGAPETREPDLDRTPSSQDCGEREQART